MPQGKMVNCPHCGTANDGHTDPTDPTNVPAPGDLCVCAYCGELAVYTDDGDLRRATPEETQEFMKDERVLVLVGLVKLRNLKNTGVRRGARG